MFKLNDDVKQTIGQEYFKRKFFRQISIWFKDLISSYPREQMGDMILKNKFLVQEIETYLTTSFDKKQIVKYISHIETYCNSLTNDNKIELTKMIYYNLPEYRKELDDNKEWLENQVKQALIALDSYVIKVKNDINTRGGQN